ncbi:inverse autotransporter beta domain-containing protein [Enterobacter sp. 22466]|uniref:inverse autotransporter beta domain-containing protein n=1 Tax=Enterobacter sp. 22466 TaxID=3453924 RepID=UPI003F82D9F2
MLKALSWLQLLLQIFFQFFIPLYSSFNAVNSWAKNLPDNVTSQAALQTFLYLLKPTDSLSEVAKKYHLTIEQLWQLNRRDYLFKRDFLALKSGEAVRVPVTQQSPVDEDQNHLAGFLSQFGTRFSGDHDSNKQQAAREMATGFVTSPVANEASRWLSQYGNARIDFNVDDRGNLERSQFDMLLPLYNQPDTLVFSQFGVRRLNHRTIANLGMGQRHFFPHWMLGYNVFYDQQLSGVHNQRLGLGLESWADYLKVAGNGYFRLSDWQASTQMEDYDERPANGFDLRMQAYLPAWPQLGGEASL